MQKQLEYCNKKLKEYERKTCEKVNNDNTSKNLDILRQLFCCFPFLAFHY